jgi:hypothetical protein
VLAGLGLLLSLLVPAAPGPPRPLRAAGPLSPRIASYQIAVEFDPKLHRLHGHERLWWRNTRPTAAATLPFHLYLNAFKNTSSVFMREAARGEGRQVFPFGHPGWIDVRSIRSGVRELRPAARIARCGEDDPAASAANCPKDETIMDVPLPAPVAPGATVVLDLDFDAQLPEIFERTGYADRFHMVAQWFPKIGVYEASPAGGDRWSCHAFHANSEFYADFGVYDVEITAPLDQVIAATGVLVEARTLAGGKRLHRYRAEDVHDFAFAADPDFLVARTRFEDVEIALYYHAANQAGVARELAVARHTLDFLGRFAFPYPYHALTIVEPTLLGLNAGGMEYPTLVTTAPMPPDLRGVHYFDEIIAHEIGHQWWYGTIASDEFEEAWLDEGVNSYVTELVLADRFGEAATALDLDGLVASGLEHERRAFARMPGLDALETPSWRFAPRHYWIVYEKTALALRTLEAYVGRAELRAALGAYARAAAFTHPHARDFYAAIASATGQDLGWFFHPVFETKGVLDYEVAEVRSVPATAVVRRRGELALPIAVEARFADGTRRHAQWDGRGAERRLTFEATTPLVEAAIDPLPLDIDHTNDGRRTEARTEPARRLFAGLVFWLQGLYSMVGP